MRRLFILLSIFITIGSSAQTVGLITQTTSSQDGYILFSPLSSTQTYLIDKCGKEIHQWSSSYKPGQSVYLLEDGSLLRPGNSNNATFNAGGSGGIIEKLDWNSNILYSYSISSTTECQHHDICYLPNGNILAIVWEMKTSTEAILAGRDSSKVGTTLWSEKIVELQPSGSNAASIVWEWHVWDHLVQDYDKNRSSYDTIAHHPELVDLNFTGANATNSDWLHINSVAYNLDFDQIMLGVHNFNEIWIIDHSTTIAEAASHTGGNYNKGGDLLYRWGNPQIYGAGSATDQKLFGQHNPHWIEAGLTDAGKILVFNNGQGRPDGNYSTVGVINPPVDLNGNYALISGQAYAPSSFDWEYKATTPTDFYSSNISGAQRITNGNTLICEGTKGTFFEVDNSGNIVWEYIDPVNGSGPISQGTTPSQNSVFRCTLYSTSYSGFNGQTLTPGNPIESNPTSYSCATNNTAGISASQNISEFVLVSNPFHSTINLMPQKEISDATITLMNANGEEVQKWENVTIQAGAEMTLQLSDLREGLYILNITSPQGRANIKLVHHP